MEKFTGTREFPASKNHPYVCPYCDSAWAAAEFLEEHVLEDHKVCTGCDKDLDDDGNHKDTGTLNCYSTWLNNCFATVNK